MLNKVNCRIATKKIVLLSFAFASLYANAQKVKVEIGKTFKVTTSSEETTDMMGGENIIKVNSISTIKIISLEKNLYKASNTLTKLIMSGNFMGQDLTFDSDNKADLDGIVGEMIGSKINKAFEFTINANTGENKEITEEKEGGFGAMMGKGSEGNTVIFYPAVIGKKQGDKWSDTKEVKGIKTISNYEVVSIKGNVSTISVSITSKGNTTNDMDGKSTDLVVDSKNTGTMKIDNLNGLLKQSTTSAESSTSTDIGRQNMSIINKSKVITTVE